MKEAAERSSDGMVPVHAMVLHDSCTQKTCMRCFRWATMSQSEGEIVQDVVQEATHDAPSKKHQPSSELSHKADSHKPLVSQDVVARAYHEWFKNMTKADPTFLQFTIGLVFTPTGIAAPQASLPAMQLDSHKPTAPLGIVIPDEAVLWTAKRATEEEACVCVVGGELMRALVPSTRWEAAGCEL